MYIGNKKLQVPLYEVEQKVVYNEDKMAQI